jgi:hypothetical protein
MGRPERRPHAREATPADLVVAAAWVTTAAESERWAGPDITFPVEQDALRREAAIGLYEAFGFRRPQRPGRDTRSPSSVPMELRVGRRRPEPPGGGSPTRPFGALGPRARS